jgi:hypothetical protein
VFGATALTSWPYESAFRTDTGDTCGEGLRVLVGAAFVPIMLACQGTDNRPLARAVLRSKAPNGNDRDPVASSQPSVPVPRESPSSGP